MNVQAIDKLRDYTNEVLRLNNIEDNIIKQKLKVEWLRLGDGNNSYFHASLKARQRQDQLDRLEDDNGKILTHQNEIEIEIVNYYKNLVGTSNNNLANIDIEAKRKGPQLNVMQREILIAPITEEEILKSLKGLKYNSAPGLDGYNAKLYKVTWDFIKHDTICAIKDFFEKDKIYKAVNCTIVTLIPKHNSATRMKNFRDISCCIIVYKLISRILTKRLGFVISSSVHSSQAAFVPSKRIHDHKLMAYDLMKGYFTKNGAPKCMLQMDLQKAYDTVEWSFLEAILKEFSFPHQFIQWIMLTIKIVSYRFQINDCLSQLLESKRGLIQGDPLYILLFVLLMEYLHRFLQKFKEQPNFNFHSKFEKMAIMNLIFADDLLLFSREIRN
ncbi:unnamed protein product [Lathyrus sativus]|nr:unnamed protein product [Lathyrus sativus]